MVHLVGMALHAVLVASKQGEDGRAAFSSGATQGQKHWDDGGQLGGLCPPPLFQTRAPLTSPRPMLA